MDNNVTHTQINVHVLQVINMSPEVFHFITIRRR